MPKKLSVIVAPILLGACAGKALIVQEATSAAELAAEANHEVEEYFSNLHAQRRDAMVALVASHPNCRWGSDVTIYVRQPQAAVVKDAPLCLADGQAAPTGYSPVRIQLSRGGVSDAYELAATQVAVITAYESALLAALDQKPRKIFDDLSFALALATKVPVTAGKLAGTDLAPLADAQAAAAGDLIQMFSALQQEADQATQVRLKMQEQGNRIQPALTDLTKMVQQLPIVSGQLSSQIEELGLETAYSAEAGRIGFDQRRTFISAIAAAQLARMSATARAQPLLEAIAKLQRIDTELQAALTGNYSEEQRRRVVALNRSRLISVIGHITDLIP